MAKEIVYEVTIKEVSLKFNSNITPYIEIVGETNDNNKNILKSCYYLANGARFYSHNELCDLFKRIGIQLEENNFLDCLKSLLSKEVYFVPIDNLSSKYNILIDYKDAPMETF